MKKIILFLIIISILALPITDIYAQYGLDKSAEEAGLDKAKAEPQQIIARIVGYILAMIGIVFLVYIIMAGYSWMMAGGNEEKIKKAKDKIVNSTIGLAIILLAYILSSAIFDLLYEVQL